MHHSCCKQAVLDPIFNFDNNNESQAKINVDTANVFLATDLIFYMDGKMERDMAQMMNGGISVNYTQYINVKSDFTDAADEVADYNDLNIQTRVNNEIRQNDNTSNLMFPFDYIISYLSTFMTLKPGDMISTGTPNGAGARFEPPIYLKPGDIVEVDGAGVGILRNGVVDEVL